jgi:pilus assembly protein CpaC
MGDEQISAMNKTICVVVYYLRWREMKSLKLLTKKNFKKIVLLFILIAGVFLFNNLHCLAASKNIKDQAIIAKGEENFSKDWIINQFDSLRIDNKTQSRKNLKNNHDQNENNKPIAYQQISDFSNQNFDLSEENIIFDDEDKNFEKVKGGITDIRATVGKSQIIQFAQPIKRLSITDPSLADLILLSPTQMIMNGKAAGVTSLIIWDETDQPAFFDLYVQNDTSDLMDAFRKVAPDEPINIKITDDGNVILSGTISSTIVRDQLKKISEAYGYALIDVAESPVPQVVLELRIAEISRSVTKNFNFFYKVAAWADLPFTLDQWAPLSQRDPNGGIGGQWDGNSINGFTAAIFKPDARFQGVIRMAQTRGLLNILAEPKLVSTNGREALFDAGQSVPVPTGVDQNGNLAYEYKDVGVKVTFTPWIAEKSQRVELKVMPEVSEIDPSVTIQQANGVTIYGFRKRSATTTVELENGETLMMAGLITRRNTNSKTGAPFFSDIPIIGNFLQQSTFDKSESELVIMVTPKIIKPGIYGEILGTAD